MGFTSIFMVFKISIGNHSKNWRKAIRFHKSWILASVCSQISILLIEANCLSKYFYRVEMALEVLCRGLKIGFGNHPNGWREFNWFDVGCIFPSACSLSSILPIEANCLSKYFFRVELALELLSRGWKLGLEIILKVEESLIGLI